MTNRMKFHQKLEKVQRLDGPQGSIQWKGTDVCIDISCKCGEHMHFDGTFLYFIRCPHCDTVYAVGNVVKLIELSPEDMVLGGVTADEVKSPLADSDAADNWPPRITGEKDDAVKEANEKIRAILRELFGPPTVFRMENVERIGAAPEASA